MEDADSPATSLVGTEDYCDNQENFFEESLTACQASASRATLSGATGKSLAEEIQKWNAERNAQAERRLSHGPSNIMERVELRVKEYYDVPIGTFFNFIYDVLQFSSGRDKLCAFMQGYAKFASEALSNPDSERQAMYRGIEDSLSEGRKIFRLFKEFREAYKIRRGFHRMYEAFEGGSFVNIGSVCGVLDMCAHTASLLYTFFDNVLWAASVGLIRSKEIPIWQRDMWTGFRKNGPFLERFGGTTGTKMKKNTASIYRLAFAIIANILLLYKALKESKNRFEGPDDARLFHIIELSGMFASVRVLRSKLGHFKISHTQNGLLSMLAALCGIWSNWRKVRRKKCGSKAFLTTVERRRSIH